jgi:hypothetical protein
MCAYQRKSWMDKRNLGKVPEVKRIDKNFADIKAGEKMLIATPQVVDDYIRQIPKGTETSLLQMRKDLAAEFHADKTCPVTSGIFLRIVAEAAYEEYEKGKAINKITPFWRMINEKSPTAKKLSFGTKFLLAQRKKEGLGNG